MWFLPLNFEAICYATKVTGTEGRIEKVTLKQKPKGGKGAMTISGGRLFEVGEKVTAKALMGKACVLGMYQEQ